MISVPAEGPKDCLMAIVGNEPGTQEEQDLRPFCGPAGAILNTKLHMNGISRYQCYITDLVKTRSSTWWWHHKGEYKGKKYKKHMRVNDFNGVFWNKSEPTEYLLECREALLQELCEVKTNVILALGGDALWALTGYRDIGKWRGSILSCTLPNGRNVKVVGAWHPAAIYIPLKKVSPGGMAHIIQADIGKAKAQSGFPELNLPKRSLIIKPTHKMVHEFVMDNVGKPKVAYDIETAPGSILCCSLAYSKNEAMTIPTTAHYWNGTTNLLRILRLLNFALTLPNVMKVAQFMDYDFVYLFRFFGINITKPWSDNAVAQHCCYPEWPKGHDFQCSFYTDEPYYKDELKHWMKGSEDIERLWTYCARDGATEFECSEELDIEMDDFGVRPTFDFMMDLMEPLIFIMLHGMRFDNRARERHRKYYTEKFKKDEAIIKERYGDVNPRSSKQVLELLKKLGIKPPMYKGKPTTNKNALAKLAKQHPALESIMGIRSSGVFISTFIDVVLDPIDDRYRFKLNQVKAVTSRLASSESSFWGVGNNCMLPDAEVLTPTGWVKFIDFKEGMKAMQWSPGGKLSWCAPILHKHDYAGPMIKADSTIHKNVYTPNHKIPKLTKRGFFHGISAKQASEESNWFIPLSGSFEHGKINIPTVRLLALIQADGSIEKNMVRFGFKKQRKIDRFIWLLNNLDIDFHEIAPSNGARKFIIPTHEAKPYIDVLNMNGKKAFGEWILWLTKEGRYELLDEIRYWDAYIVKDSFEYYTAIKENADWVATLAHLCEHSATLTVTEENYPTNNSLYRVNIKPRIKAYQKSEMYSTIDYSGDIYCLTTPSSYFLTRYDDRIVVTGNSENWPKYIRNMAIPDKGLVILLRPT